MKTGNSWMETDPIRKRHLVRIEMLAAALGNRDTHTASEAADRLMEGQAAFWHVARGGDDFTGGVCDLANMLGDLLASCEQKQVWTRKRINSPEWILDRLVPLNDEAVDQLQRAYAKAGSFRESHDISARETRVVVEGGVS